jgi:N-acetylmuramoyl-L-alanine amidase
MELYKRGSRGEAVKQIQKALAGAGLKVITDGVYGTITEEAVREFQSKNGLKPDGIVGPATLAKLIPARLKRSKRTIKEIIVHCSATPEGKDYTVLDIRRWHKQQGWSDIGYHYVIYRNGHVEPGRNVDIAGAHCEGHNMHSIGVCYIGGMTRDGKNPKDTRTLSQKAALLSLLLDLKKLYPQAKIYGHCDFSNKACPCFDAKDEYRRL